MDVVNLETGPLASVAMEALGHIGICGALPLLVNDSSPGQFILQEPVCNIYVSFQLMDLLYQGLKCWKFCKKD